MKISDEDNEFHESINARMRVLSDLGVLNSGGDGRVWRLTYLCSHCKEEHKVRGTLWQCTGTGAGMLYFGSPWMDITDEALAQDEDIAGGESRLRTHSEHLEEFLKKSGGT